MEKIQNLLASYPILVEVLIIAFGLFLLLGSIFDWHIIFGDVNRSNYNLEKLDGIINVFGRKAGRIFCGFVSLVIIGIGVLWICTS